jgi:hypothetical protein
MDLQEHEHVDSELSDMFPEFIDEQTQPPHTPTPSRTAAPYLVAGHTPGSNSKAAEEPSSILQDSGQNGQTSKGDPKNHFRRAKTMTRMMDRHVNAQAKGVNMSSVDHEHAESGIEASGAKNWQRARTMIHMRSLPVLSSTGLYA